MQSATWHSEQIDKVCAALADARKDIKLIHHNATMVVAKMAPKVGYATLDQLIENIVEPLAKHGLVLTTGHDIYCERLWIVAKALHKSGQWVSEGVVVPEARSNDRDHWGNITSGRRYALMSLLNLSVAGEDDAAARPTTLNQIPEAKPAGKGKAALNADPALNADQVSLSNEYATAKNAINGLGGTQYDDAALAKYLGKPIKSIDADDIKKLRKLFADVRKELKEESKNA